jgi:hypothetical protein
MNDSGQLKECLILITTDVLILVMNPGLTSKDEGFMWMQHFYTQMNGIAKEVMFLPMLNLFFSFLPIRTVQTRLLNGESVDFIGDSRRVSL